MWISTGSFVVARQLVAGLRAVHRQAARMTHPQSLRRARAQALRIVTVVAGH